MLNIEKYQDEIRDRLEEGKYIKEDSKKWEFLGEALWNTSDVVDYKSKNLPLEIFDWLLAEYSEQPEETFDTLTIKSFSYNNSEIVLKNPYVINVKISKYGLLADDLTNDFTLGIFCVEDDMDMLENRVKRELSLIYELFVLSNETASIRQEKIKNNFLKYLEGDQNG